ncbi:MAG: hypothetical protein Unbinned3907contig1000_8 [Prokaryotic dsDNA virus sp.]|nr:MAG: hypothetical protein Unbinned3907contig1000_8 [Prokaryotic dsDNA virus sp.]|tara:strand:- start:5629 stop:6177 length:549 start_codon:yes stop_codon:yes gene_type:complete
MSCDLTAGRLEPCKNSVGGIKHAYFIDFKDVGSWTYTDDTITGMSKADGVSTANAYKYELKGGNNLEQNITSSRENGTTFVEQTLTMVLKKQTIASHKEMKLLAWARPFAIIEDYNGNFFLMGVDNGAEVTTTAVSTGTAMGDLNGYTVTMVAHEKLPANFINFANEAAMETGLGITVVPGT